MTFHLTTLFATVLAVFSLLPQAAMAQNVIKVATVAVQVKALGSGFELDGVVAPVKQSTVSAQTNGRIASLLVKAGDKVRAGQLLATIDDREAQAGVQRSDAQVAQATAELRNAQANFDRTRDLHAKGFISGSALDTADSQLKAALAGRAQATAGAKLQSLAQGYSRVAAPFDAWVLQTSAEVGDLAVAGKPLVTLYAPLPLRVVVLVPVSRGVQATANGGPEIELRNAAGALQWVRPASSSALPMADATSQLVEWRLELQSEFAKSLLPGEQVRVRFSGAAQERLVVPSAAILRRGELTAVYIAPAKSAGASGFVLRAVRLGADHGAQGIEVLAGLAAGDVVALDPVKAGLALATFQ